MANVDASEIERNVRSTAGLLGWNETRIGEEIRRELERAEKERDLRGALLALGATPEEVDAMLKTRGREFDDRLPLAQQLVRHRENVDRQRQEDHAAVRAQLLRVGVPSLHLDHVFDQAPEETEALRVVRDWITNKLTFLVLLGDPGCGKSAAAAHALSRLAPPRPIRGVDGQFVDARRLAKLLRFDAEDDYEAVEKCGCLVLDDLGAEYLDARGWQLAGLDGLINARYGSQLRTIITSNLDLAQFRARFGERIADRLRESGHVASIAEGSIRRRVRERRGVR